MVLLQPDKQPNIRLCLCRGIHTHGSQTYGNVGIGNVAMSLDASAFKGSTQPDILKLNGTVG